MDLMSQLRLEKTILDDLEGQWHDIPYCWFPFISDPVLRSEESGKHFTLLLFSRANNPPHRFAMADALFHSSQLLNKIEPHAKSRYWYGMRIFLKSEEVAQGRLKYGEIVTSYKSSFASGRCLPARMGAALLHIQARIYSFLVLALKNLFSERDEMKDIDSLKLRDSPLTLNSKHIVARTSDPIFFRVDGQVQDIEDIIKILQDKLSKASAHIQDLRDNPVYFKDRFLEMIEHQPDNLSRGSYKTVADPKAPGGTKQQFCKDKKNYEPDMSKVQMVASKYKVYH